MTGLEALLPSTAVYGDTRPAVDDPAEVFHEASKFQPSLLRRQTAGIVRLGDDTTLLNAVGHTTGRRHPQRLLAPLPAPVGFPPRGRSPSRVAGGTLTAVALASVLHAGYGAAEDGMRAVPSAGALYPLELYPVVLLATGVERGVHRYDPGRHALELVRRGDVGEELAAAVIAAEAVVEAAVVILIASVFWRTRFKYGLRGYRFALLEAGHCAQNMLLSAHSLGLDALPLGGYFDSRMERLVGVDGVDEAVVYAVALGGER